MNEAIIITPLIERSNSNVDETHKWCYNGWRSKIKIQRDDVGIILIFIISQ